MEQIFELMIAKECKQKPGAFWICIKSETAPKETMVIVRGLSVLPYLRPIHLSQADVNTMAANKNGNQSMVVRQFEYLYYEL